MAMNRDVREAGLPKWVQQIIDGLRTRLEHATEPLVTELAKLRPQMELLKARNEAMTELLGCAARGEHKDAQEIMNILDNYDLTLTKRSD